MAESTQQTSTQADKSKGRSRKWFVRKRDGSVFGPETTEVLLEWAAQCRLVSGNEVSEDSKVWVAAERIPELQMCWTASLPDGRTYGPFNVLATHELNKHNVLSADAKLTNTITGETTTVGERVEQELKHKQGDMFGAEEPDSPKPKRKRKRSKKSDATGREDTVAPEDSKETQALRTELEGLRAQSKTLEERTRKHKETLKTRTAEHKAELAAIVEERNALAAELEQLREQSQAVPAAEAADPEQITALEEQLEACGEELEAARSELKSKQEDLAALGAKLSDTSQELEVALEATEKKLSDESARVAELTGELEEVRGELEEARQALREGAAAEGESNDEDKATIEALSRQIRVLKEDLEKTRLDLEGAREALEAKHEEVQAMRIEIRDSDTPVDERVEELEARLHAVVLDAANKEKTFKRERSELRERLNETEQRLEESREQALELAEKLKKAEAGVSSADARQRALRTDMESRYSRTRRELAGAQMALTETRRKLSFFAIAGVVCLALAVIFVCLWLGARRDRDRVPGQSAVAGAGEPTGAVEESQQEQPSGVVGETGTGTAPPFAAGGAKTPTYPRVKAPGVSTKFTTTTCTMTFEQPVFTSMATISTAAKTQLKQIAMQVRDYMGDFTLTVRGHTDNVPLRGKGLYRNNQELGLARAKAVHAFLASEGKLSARSMEVVSAGDKDPPFPNDKVETRRKNRTVVLILTKKK